MQCGVLFFFQAEDGIRDIGVTGVQTCALPILRGYKEEGTTTTPFDMVMLNDMDRYHLVIDVIDRVPSLRTRASHVRQRMVDTRLRLRAYTRDHGEDSPEVTGWAWEPEAEVTPRAS